MKQKLYNFIVKQGLNSLSKLFPDIHRSIPLKPTDRFLEYPFVFKHLPPNKNIKLLDIGSAGSFFPLITASLGYDTTGCDIRPYEILNNLEFDNFRFIQRDICKNSLPKKSFDVITCISTLEHIGLKGRYGAYDTLGDDLIMLYEIYETLKLGGLAILTLPYGKADIFPPHLRIYDLNRVRRITANFHIIEEKFYCYDVNDDWRECNAMEGQTKATPNKYNLALLCLRR